MATTEQQTYMKKLPLLLSLCCSLAIVPAVHAQMITDLGSTYTSNGQTIVLNNYLAFVAYQGQLGNSVGLTDKNNFADFTNLTGGNNLSATGGSAFTYSSASEVGASGTGNESATADSYFSYSNLGSGSVALSTTLVSGSETFGLYLDAYNATTNLSLSLTDSHGAAISLTGSNIGTVNLYSGSTATYSGTNFGLEQFSISGAAAGDVLTITDTTGNKGSYANVGISAVVLEDAPEPSTYALFSAGLGLLAFIGRARYRFL
jgi:hypothetical protein